jgi:hypothetical protein
MKELFEGLFGLAYITAWMIAPMVAIVSDAYTWVDVLVTIALPIPFDWVWLVIMGGGCT